MKGGVIYWIFQVTATNIRQSRNLRRGWNLSIISYCAIFQIMKTELPLSPDNLVVSPSSTSNLTENSSVYRFPNNIRFNPFFSEKWTKMTTARLAEISNPQLTITADKGFNFSTQDDAFIVQKKNHFQVTCEIEMDGMPRFVKKSDGTLQVRITKPCLTKSIGRNITMYVC